MRWYEMDRKMHFLLWDVSHHSAIIPSYHHLLTVCVLLSLNPSGQNSLNLTSHHQNYWIKFLPFLLETKDMKALDTRSPNIFSVGQFIFSNSRFFLLLFFFFQYSIFSNTDITWRESLAQLYQVRAWRWFSQRVAAVTSVFGEQSGWRISFNSFRDCFLSLSGRVSAELIKHRRKYYFINLN